MKAGIFSKATAARRVICLAMIFLCADAVRAQQFNRIGTVMTVAEAYTAAAAADLGGAENLEVDMDNACAGANLVMQNSGTGTYVDMVGFYEVAESDPGSLHTALSDLNGVWTDADNFAFVTNGAGILQCVVDGTDDAGLSYECGSLGTVSSVYGAWYVVFSHELGRNCCLEQGDDVGSGTWDCIMLFNYCTSGNSPIPYCSNPSVYYGGIQLLGTTSDDCSEGPLANEGNNARQFTLNGPNYTGSKPVSLSSLNVYNPTLTAVHCGGAAVATQSADERTFAADQNYNGGTAWDANGYSYAVDVSGVTNPAPQTAYQDQRYGNCSYTFDNYLPGTNYLVRLHFMECCWSAPGQREFNVFINGSEVLTNFDIFATAGAQDRAVIREIMTTANANGQIVVGFSNVVDNASISAIEILQGGMYSPINLAASAGIFEATLAWSATPGATSYNVKRATSDLGPFVTITNTTATGFTDQNLTAGQIYYYVVSAVNGGNESFNSAEASVTPESPALTWNSSGADLTGAQDGSGAWTAGTTANWWNGASNVVWSNGGQEIATFGAGNGAAGIVTLSGGITADGVIFNPAGSGNYTLAGGGNVLTLAGPITANTSATINAPVDFAVPSAVDVGSGQALTLGGVVSGSGGITFAGAGTTILATNETYSGGTTNENGTLQLGNGGMGGSPGTGQVENDSLLEFNRSDNFTWATAVSDPGDAGTFLKLNTNTMTVTSANQYLASSGGVVQMNGGTVQLNSPGLMQAGSPQSGGQFWIAENAATGACVVNGGTLISSSWLCVGRNSPASQGTLTVNSGVVEEQGNGGNIMVGSLGARGTLTVNGGVVSNAAALWLGEGSGGQGTLNLNGGLVQASQVTPSLNDYGGTAIVNFNGGILQATTNDADFLTANPALIQANGAVIDDGGNSIAITQPLTAGVGDGGLTKDGFGTLNLSASNTYAGPTTIEAGTLRLQDPILHFSFDNVSGNTIINDGAGGTALNGTIVGSAAVVSGGRFGNCLSVPSGTAAAGYVLVNSPVVAMTGTNSWTIAMWVKTTTAGGVYAYQGSGGWSSGNMTFYLNEGSDAGYGSKAGGVSWGQGWEEGSTAINDGNWHFLVMTCNGSSKAMFLDGRTDSIASSWAANTGTGNQFWVGGSPDTGDEDVGLNGWIDEVYVYNRALSLPEVQTLMTNNAILNHSVLPSATAVTVSTGAALDLGGLNQTIGALSGSNGSSVLLSSTTNADTLTVGNSGSTIFDGALSGNGSLIKTGTGTLTLAGPNNYSGATTISAGTLAFGTETLQPVLHFTFDQAGGSVVTNLGTGGAAMNGTLTGSASIFPGGRFGNALHIPSGAATSSYVLVNNPVVPLNGNPGSSWTVGMWLKTSTAGAVYLYQGDGGWAYGNTEFYLENGTQGDGAGSHAGGVRYAEGWESGTATIDDGNWHFVVMTCDNGVKTMYVDGALDALLSGGQTSWTAAGTGGQVRIGGAASGADSQIGFNGFIDEVYVFNRALTEDEIQNLMADETNFAGNLPPASGVSVATGATLDLSGTAQVIGSLSGAGAVTNSAPSPAVLTINDATNSIFSGGIGDGGPGNHVTVIKAGAAEEIFSGANTYSGPTIVSNGTLLVDGSLGGGAATVAGGTLGGTGIIGGPVTIQPGGTLAPGISSNSIGTLTIDNNLNLSGETFIKLNAAGQSNDMIGGLAQLTYGGTLTVTNLAGTPAAGNQFKIFSAASYEGGFSAFNLPPLGTNLVWNTAALAGGMLTVGRGPVAPHFGPISLQALPGGAGLILSGSGGAADYPFSVLESTNLDIPLARWTVAGTGTFDNSGNFIFTNQIGTQSSQEFYELLVQ